MMIMMMMMNGFRIIFLLRDSASQEYKSVVPDALNNVESGKKFVCANEQRTNEKTNTTRGMRLAKR